MKKKNLVVLVVAVMLFTLLAPGAQLASAQAEGNEKTFVLKDGTTVKIKQEGNNVFTTVHTPDGEMTQELTTDLTTKNFSGTVEGETISGNVKDYAKEITCKSGCDPNDRLSPDYEYHGGEYLVASKYSDHYNLSGDLYKSISTYNDKIHELNISAGTYVSVAVSILLTAFIFSLGFTVAIASVLSIIESVMITSLGVVVDYFSGTLATKRTDEKYRVVSDGYVGLSRTDSTWYADVNRWNYEPDSYTEVVKTEGHFDSYDTMLDLGIYNVAVLYHGYPAFPMPN